MPQRSRIYYLLSVSLLSLCANAQTPLTLRQTLQQVRANSPVLRVERLNINAAQADQVTANLRPNPVVNNQTLFQLNQTPTTPVSDAVSPFNRQRRQFWLQATKEFDIYNKRAYRSRFAESNTNLATKSVAET